jgi:hypothetical protein
MLVIKIDKDKLFENDMLRKPKKASKIGNKEIKATKMVNVRKKNIVFT